MINHMLEECDFSTVGANVAQSIKKLQSGEVNSIAALITLAEQQVDLGNEVAATAEAA